MGLEPAYISQSQNNWGRIFLSFFLRKASTSCTRPSVVFSHPKLIVPWPGKNRHQILFFVCFLEMLILLLARKMRRRLKKMITQFLIPSTLHSLAVFPFCCVPPIFFFSLILFVFFFNFILLEGLNIVFLRAFFE